MLGSPTAAPTRDGTTLTTIKDHLMILQPTWLETLVMADDNGVIILKIHVKETC